MLQLARKVGATREGLSAFCGAVYAGCGSDAGIASSQSKLKITLGALEAPFFSAHN